MTSTKRSITLLALAATGMLSACANYEVNSYRGNVPGYYIRYEMQDADRALDAARQAGKDKLCPAEFKAAEAAKDNAYDVYRACHTEEGVALAKQAVAKTNALCPPQAPKVEPPPPPKPAPKPAPVVAPPPAPAPPPPAPAPAPPAPTGKLTIQPGTITKGETAQLAWTSQNATGCDIQPGIGQVPPQGSRTITPAENKAYTLVCKGAGGTADSAANVTVTAPPEPVAKPKLCSPVVINIQFDTNKADIKPAYHDELKKLAAFLTEFPKATGSIDGHTDSVGDKASNMKLSQRRADSVRSYLIKHFSIAPERIEAKGYGPTKPIADNKTKEGMQKNRRTEANFSCNN